MSLTTLQTTRVGDITLAYRVAGDGDAVLLIHGALVADTLVPLAEASALSPFRRILYHRRGYGHSPRPEPVRPVTLAEHAEDALGLLDHHDIGAAHIVSHSGGALIALALAARQPGRVMSLALIEPPTAFRRPPGAQWLAGILALAEHYAAGDVRGAVRGFYDSIYQPGWRARMERSRPGAFEESVRDAAMAFESDMPGADWYDGLQADEVAAVRCPVLSVLGTGTLPLFADGRKLLHDWFPWCQDADIDGGDHMLPIEYPDATAAAIASFLATPTGGDGHTWPPESPPVTAGAHTTRCSSPAAGRDVLTPIWSPSRGHAGSPPPG
jgi:pimeloyl-ACP methyl ester carboxylesterase